MKKSIPIVCVAIYATFEALIYLMTAMLSAGLTASSPGLRAIIFTTVVSIVATIFVSLSYGLWLGRSWSRRLGVIAFSISAGATVGSMAFGVGGHGAASITVKAVSIVASVAAAVYLNSNRGIVAFEAMKKEK